MSNPIEDDFVRLRDKCTKCGGRGSVGGMCLGEELSCECPGCDGSGTKESYHYITMQDAVYRILKWADGESLSNYTAQMCKVIVQHFAEIKGYDLQQKEKK